MDLKHFFTEKKQQNFQIFYIKLNLNVKNMYDLNPLPESLLKQHLPVQEKPKH